MCKERERTREAGGKGTERNRSGDRARQNVQGSKEPHPLTLGGIITISYRRARHERVVHG